ncbi:MAG: ribonuclease III [Actinomycetota bacterium]
MIATDIVHADRERLAARLGHGFADPDLLLESLTHRSWCAENDDAVSNERLEFLGDAVLGLVVTDRLFELYPGHAEGDLSRMRSTLVSAETLADVAEELELGDDLRLGKGEEATGGRAKRSILADAMEAVIGAVHLDGGADASRRLVLELLAGRIRQAPVEVDSSDHKTSLQELSARRFGRLPRYAITEDGPDHAKVFTAAVLFDGEEYGRGRGRSKKQAEQAAAAAACARLADEERVGPGHATNEPSPPDESGAREEHHA